MVVARAPSYAAPLNAAARLPRVMLWAWERPEDLRGIGADAGVAFLAQTVTIDGDRVTRRPRMQPLRVDPSAALVAVTRIETGLAAQVWRAAGQGGQAGRAGTEGRKQADVIGPIVDWIARTATMPQAVGVQIDFDATASERAFYRGVVERVRARLPRDVALSVT